MKIRTLKLEKKKKAQVWIETVIYTLIGITIIGILLAVSKPKIDSMKDKLAIEQTIDSLNSINDKIHDIQQSSGNVRVIELKVSKGKLIINPQNDSLLWRIESKYQYSELGSEINIGNQKVITTGGNPFIVDLRQDYPSIDITFNGAENIKNIESASTPYSLRIENKGISSGRTNIDFSVT